MLFVLGTVHEQAEYNGGGRTAAEAARLVDYFNVLLMLVRPGGFYTIHESSEAYRLKSTRG